MNIVSKRCVRVCVRMYVWVWLQLEQLVCALTLRCVCRPVELKVWSVDLTNQYAGCYQTQKFRDPIQSHLHNILYWKVWGRGEQVRIYVYSMHIMHVQGYIRMFTCHHACASGFWKLGCSSVEDVLDYNPLLHN